MGIRERNFKKCACYGLRSEIVEQIKNPMALLETNAGPVFCVQNGSVIYANTAAATRGVEIGAKIDDLLVTGKQEYADFCGKSLYLCLDICGCVCSACVSREAEFDIFVLETDEEEKTLQALALAARELRAPLASIITASEQLFPGKTDEVDHPDQVRHLNKSIYQLLRIISNMSDASRYAKFHAPAEAVELCGFFNELMEKGAALTSQANVRLQFSGLSQPLHAVVNPEQLERAVYNLLSNAIKFSPAGGVIQVRLKKQNNMLYITVQDEGPGIRESLRGSVFTRFRREPGVEDGLNGIGLGMVMVRAAAASHGGTVLLEQLPGAGLRVTMTLQLAQNSNVTLRSPAYRVDYLGELDHSLVELSDALPADAYNSIN